MAVAAALPTAARELHGLALYGWAFTGFLVANVVGLVLSGMLSDRRGPGWPLAYGVLLFLLGLIVAGFAPEMAVLVVGRVIQGLGSGLLLTALYVIIGERYHADLRPKIFAAISSAWVLPSLIGPPVAGVLTQTVGLAVGVPWPGPAGRDRRSDARSGAAFDARHVRDAAAGATDPTAAAGRARGRGRAGRAGAGRATAELAVAGPGRRRAGRGGLGRARCWCRRARSPSVLAWVRRWPCGLCSRARCSASTPSSRCA